MAERDFLDKMVTQRAARNPAFPQMLDAARRRRELLRTRGASRAAESDADCGRRSHGTSRSFVARLESTAGEAKVSTVERYAGSLEYVLRYHLVPLNQPTVVVHESSSVSKGVCLRLGPSPRMTGPGVAGAPAARGHVGCRATGDARRRVRYAGGVR